MFGVHVPIGSWRLLVISNTGIVSVPSSIAVCRQGQPIERHSRVEQLPLAKTGAEHDITPSVDSFNHQMSHQKKWPLPDRWYVTEGYYPYQVRVPSKRLLVTLVHTCATWNQPVAGSVHLFNDPEISSVPWSWQPTPYKHARFNTGQSFTTVILCRRATRLPFANTGVLLLHRDAGVVSCHLSLSLSLSLYHLNNSPYAHVMYQSMLRPRGNIDIL
ncbi:hypothetical protein V8C37DRAFT_381198 [Trichoderma ceciliae]